MPRSSVAAHLVMTQETISEARRHMADAAMREHDQERLTEIMDLRDELYELQLKIQRYADTYKKESPDA